MQVFRKEHILAGFTLTEAGTRSPTGLQETQKKSMVASRTKDTGLETWGPLSLSLRLSGLELFSLQTQAMQPRPCYVKQLLPVSFL